MKRGAIFIGAENKDFLSEAIRNVSRSKWSHCAIILDSTPFESYVMGSRTFGTDITTLTEYNDTLPYYYRIYDIELPQAQVDKVLRDITDKNLGKAYGYFQLAVGFPIWYKLKDWFGILLKKNPVSLGLVCSELVAKYMKALPLKDSEVDSWNPDIIAPEHVYQLVEKRKDIFKLVAEKQPS